MTNGEPDDEHRVTTDPETVEDWAAEYDVVPVGVPGEEPKVRFLPREQAEAEMANQERLEWQEFHERFERHEFALVDRGEGDVGWRYDLVDREEAPEPATETREPGPESRESADASTEPTADEMGERTETDEPAPTGSGGTTEAERSGTTGEGSDRTVPKPRDQGKDVIDASGERIGMVADVRGGTLYVDPHPSLTGRIKAALDWGEVDEAAFPIQSEKIQRIYNDVVLAVERPVEET